MFNLDFELSQNERIKLIHIFLEDHVLPFLFSCDTKEKLISNYNKGLFNYAGIRTNAQNFLKINSFPSMSSTGNEGNGVPELFQKSDSGDEGEKDGENEKH